MSIYMKYITIHMYVLMTTNIVRYIMKLESSYTLLYCPLLLEHKMIHTQIFTWGQNTCLRR